MKKHLLTTMALAFFIGTAIQAQSFEFRYHGQKLSDGDMVTIAAEENEFGELACETNPSANPNNGLILKVLTGGALANLKAELTIEENSLDATMLQWCMGGECIPLTSGTAFTKTFTASDAEQVQFDANNIKSDGSLIAKLKVSYMSESVTISIKFTNTSTINQMWWGYFNEKDAENLDLVYDGFGSSVASTFNVGIYIPSSETAVSGSTIQAVRIWLGEDITKISGDLQFWISPTTLPEDINAADYVQTIPLNKLSKGANDILLSTPYNVNSQSIYLGYTLSIAEKAYPIMYGGSDMDNSFYLRLNSFSWETLRGHGKLAIQILLEGGTYPKNCAVVEDFGQTVVLKGGEVSIPVTITNKGKNPINSISYTIATGGKTSEERTADIPSIVLNENTQIDIPFSSDVEERKYVKILTITKVNGVANTASEKSAMGNLITVSERPTVMPVVEEFTGTWCGFCPWGIIGMKKAHERFGEEVALIAVHCNRADPMAIDAYYPVEDAYCTGYPGSRINRAEADVYPSYLDDGINDALERVTQASIEVTARWSNNYKTAIDFSTKTNFNYSDDNGQYGIAFILVEDGLTGSGSSWAQHNYLSGGGDSDDPDISFWYNSGEYVTGIAYDHVAVAAWEVMNGISGSVNKTIRKGVVQKFNYNGDISSFNVIQDKSKLKVIALLIDNVTGTIVNAAQTTIQGPDFIPGDANGDGLVNVTDIVATVNFIMEKPSEGFNKEAADLNGDGKINVTDIVKMVTIIMNSNG